jgi:hypothetical protein
VILSHVIFFLPDGIFSLLVGFSPRYTAAAAIIPLRGTRPSTIVGIGCQFFH